jgi:hypothetical protein
VNAALAPLEVEHATTHAPLLPAVKLQRCLLALNLMASGGSAPNLELWQVRVVMLPHHSWIIPRQVGCC